MDHIIIAKPKVEIDQAVKNLVQQQVERFTIVHGRVFTNYPTMVRIWPSTYLVEENGSRRRLLHPFNITMAPAWTQHLVWNDFIYFTLIFEGLSKGCEQFHLFEDITEPQGFYSGLISRNGSDVYEVELMT